jgi:hypothetical protein
MGDCVANGRIDLTGHVILIVEEQPIVALNMQIAAEEAGGEAIIARGPNEALAQLHQFMVSAAVIDPRQSALISELQLRGIRVVLKAGTTGEVLARLARSVSDGVAFRAKAGPASTTPVNRETWHVGATNRDEG